MNGRIHLTYQHALREKPPILLEITAIVQNRLQFQRISVIGGDTQIAAISAGLAEGGHFSVEGPGIDPIRVWLGETKPHTYRATLALPGRRRPVRHLISLSQEIARGASVDTTVLIDSSPEFVSQAVAKIFGLPGIPEWASWFHEQLEWRNAITPLLGVGCSPALIKGSREEFLSWLGAGVRAGTLILPKENRAIHWPNFGLEQVLASTATVLASSSTVHEFPHP